MEEELPKVSIITPTNGHRNTFPLAIYNFFHFDYPEDKLEWIIVDDGKDSIKDMIPNDYRIKYYYYDNDTIGNFYDRYVAVFKDKMAEYKKLPNKKKKGRKPKLKFKKRFTKIPIAMKRNLCISYTTSDYILHMDDDDYYPPSSIMERITALMKNNTGCVACTDRGAFHTSKMVSIMYSPSESHKVYEKLCCASLAYTKKYWSDRRFNNDDFVFEESNFVRGRNYGVIDFKKVIVVLFHKGNDNPDLFNADANGWHFDEIPDEAFKLLTSF